MFECFKLLRHAGLACACSIFSRRGLAHKWRSSSGWGDKCHTGPHITLTTVVEAVKLRRSSACWALVQRLLGWICYAAAVRPGFAVRVFLLFRTAAAFRFAL